MRHALWISALVIVVTGSACSRENARGGVPETVVAMAMNRCTPTELADLRTDPESCAAKTMAGQRMRR